jgi:hypothetical protein
MLIKIKKGMFTKHEGLQHLHLHELVLHVPVELQVALDSGMPL